MKVTPKKHNTAAHKLIPTKVLEAVIKLFDQLRDDAIKKRVSNNEMNEEMGQFISLLKKRNKKIDADRLIFDLHFFYSVKSFDDLGHAENISQELIDLSIEIPDIVKNGLKEAVIRQMTVFDLIKNNEWNKEKNEAWFTELESQLLSYSYDKQSREEYLRKLFQKAVQEIEAIEKNTLSKYDYYINGFYKELKFVGTYEQLNMFFHYAEVHAGGFTEFYNLQKLMRQYVYKHNEIVNLKKVINNNYPAAQKYTHREIMIAHDYKYNAGIEEYKSASKWKMERGNDCYNNYYTLQPKTRNINYPYKKPTEKELKNVIKILEGYPELQKQVQVKLEKL